MALVCGDPVVWKPSEKTPLTALACQAIFAQACGRYTQTTGHTLPEGLLHVLRGGAEVGDWMVSDPRLPLISATGSCRMGRLIGPKVAARLGRSLLEPMAACCAWSGRHLRDVHAARQAYALSENGG